MEATVEEWVARLRARLAAEPTLGPALAALVLGAAAVAVLLVVRGGAGAAADPAMEPPTALDVGTGIDAAHEANDRRAPVGMAATPPAGVPATPALDLTVHVAGGVAAPGLVVLDAGARVADAVAAAGGLALDAEPSGLNLARPLVDGEQVVVPRVGETPAPPQDGGADAAVPTGPVDLNTATAAQLETLDGIGPVLAGRIVAHRDARGRFTDVVELREVSGIGERTFERLAPHVVVR